MFSPRFTLVPGPVESVLKEPKAVLEAVAKGKQVAAKLLGITEPLGSRKGSVAWLLGWWTRS